MSLPSHRDARLPLAVPPRMFLEDRKDLLLLGDLLPLQDPPVRLVDLALRMRDVPVEFLELLRQGAPLQQAGPRGLRLRQKFLALGQERVDVLPPGLRAPGARHPLIQPPECHRKMLDLAPARQVPFVRQLGRDPYHHPGCVPEQVAVGGIVDIRLDDKAVAPARQPLASVVAAKVVTVPHHQFVDVSQRVLVQQRDIPHHLVIGIRHRVQIAVPEQLAKHHVRVGVFMKPVEVAAKALLQHREYENRPQFHPRTADRQIAVFPEPVQQKLENRLPHRLIQIQALQAKQDRRDVVPRLHVNLDPPNLRPAEHRLKTPQLPHRKLPRKDPGIHSAPLRTTARKHTASRFPGYDLTICTV